MTFVTIDSATLQDLVNAIHPEIIGDSPTVYRAVKTAQGILDDLHPVVRWVSCSQDTDYGTSMRRHLLKVKNGTEGTTLCGASGMGEGVWRGNTVKPECSTCKERAAEWGVKYP